MQILIDFLPIVVFFVAYRMADLYVATAALIIAMALQIGYQWIRDRTVNKLLLTSGILVAVFGGITLSFREPLFIQWKPTVVNWLFCRGLSGQPVHRRERRLPSVSWAMRWSSDPPMWRQLNLMWAGQLHIPGCRQSVRGQQLQQRQFWVNFKLFGMLGFTLLMVVIQVIWIAAKTSGQQHQEG